MGTWTFLGHWENDRLVIDDVIDGEHADARIDDGTYEQGLWAATGAGDTEDQALTALRADYE